MCVRGGERWHPKRHASVSARRRFGKRGHEAALSPDLRDACPFIGDRPPAELGPATAIDPLLDALRTHSEDRIAELLARGLDLNERGSDGNIALGIAAHNGSTKVLGNLRGQVVLDESDSSGFIFNVPAGLATVEYSLADGRQVGSREVVVAPGTVTAVLLQPTAN